MLSMPQYLPPRRTVWQRRGLPLAPAPLGTTAAGHLQSTLGGGLGELATNAMMAGVPGHPFWEETMSVLRERAGNASGRLTWQTGGWLAGVVGVAGNGAGRTLHALNM